MLIIIKTDKHLLQKVLSVSASINFEKYPQKRVSIVKIANLEIFFAYSLWLYTLSNMTSGKFKDLNKAGKSIKNV